MVPIYEYRCPRCSEITTAIQRLAEHRKTQTCEHCGAVAESIVSRPSVHRSNASKLDRLDPKYDKLVDTAMKNTAAADPDRLLKKMKPFPRD